MKKGRKGKPTQKQKEAFLGFMKGRPRTKMKEFTREGVYALRVRTRLAGVHEQWSKWRWFRTAWDSFPKYVDEWWKRQLMPKGAAMAKAEELRTLDGAEVKVIIVWRKGSGQG